MILENMKYEVKGMPDDMKKMVEREVQRQMKVTKNMVSKKKIAIAVLAATMMVGTTVIAGTQLYRMSIESEGKYGKVTKIRMQDAERANINQKVDYEIPKVKLNFNYLPKGMVESQGKYSFKETPNVGGVSPNVFEMDMGDDAFEIFDTGVLNSENIKVGNREGVYLEMTVADDKGVWMDKTMYIYYPEVHHVLQLFIGEDVSKEEALKIAEGAELVAVDNEEEAISTWAWSAYAEQQEINAKVTPEKEYTSKKSVAKTAVKGVYDIGDTFSVTSSAMDGDDYIDVNLEAKITDVQICDDISLLDKKYIAPEFYDETDENGKFLPNKINYIKYGDGVNSINETVNSSLSNQKLIYATVEYTNNTGKDLNEILYFCTAIKAVENDSSYIMYNRTSPDGSWDVARDTSKVMYGEMSYYDVRGGRKNVNYIESLKAGETKTVHIGIVVNEEELPCTFLCLDTKGGVYSFTGAIGTGLVDIRQ